MGRAPSLRLQERWNLLPGTLNDLSDPTIEFQTLKVYERKGTYIYIFIHIHIICKLSCFDIQPILTTTKTLIMLLLPYVYYRTLLFIITSLKGIWLQSYLYYLFGSKKTNQQKHEKTPPKKRPWLKMMGFLDFPISTSTIPCFPGTERRPGGMWNRWTFGCLSGLTSSLCARTGCFFFFLKCERMWIWEDFDMRYEIHIYIYL